MAYESPLPRSVYILGDGLLFDDIIAHMLASATRLRVIKRVFASESLFVSEVLGCRPDVVVVAEPGRYSTDKILGLLSQVPYPTELRIIVMSMEHEIIKILDRPAGRNRERAGGPYTIHGLADWNALIDLVSGKQVQAVQVR